ncbi:MAG: hypothetical protein FJY67_01715 [Calditrichaeota bacterium]|nr:hypothetical protein [Calditrichota bacterium]
MPKKDLKAAVSEGLKKLGARATELGAVAADFIEEQAKIGKLKFDILSLKRQIDRLKQEIGDRVIAMANSASPGNPLSDKAIQKAMRDIAGLEKGIESKRAAIARISDKAPAKASPRAAVKKKAVKSSAKPKSSPKPGGAKGGTSKTPQG